MNHEEPLRIQRSILHQPVPAIVAETPYPIEAFPPAQRRAPRPPSQRVWRQHHQQHAGLQLRGMMGCHRGWVMVVTGRGWNFHWSVASCHSFFGWWKRFTSHNCPTCVTIKPLQAGLFTKVSKHGKPPHWRVTEICELSFFSIPLKCISNDVYAMMYMACVERSAARF